MLYRISVTERGLTGIANIFRSRLSRLDDLLGAGTVPLSCMENVGTLSLTLAPAGVWANLEPAGGLISAPRKISRTTQRIEKRSTALDRPCQVLQKIYGSFLDEIKIEVTGGQKRSNFPKIGLFSQKLAIISSTMQASKISK